MGKKFVVSLMIGAALAGSFKSNLGAAEKQVTRLGGAVEQLTKANTRLARADQLSASMGKTRKEMAETQREMTRLGRAMQAGGGKELAARFDAARAKSDRLKSSLRSQATELQTLKQGLNAAGLATSDFAGQQVKLGKSLDQAKAAQARIDKTRAAQDANKAARQRYQGGMIGSAAAGMALGAPVMVAANFEQSMANVGSVAGLDLAGQQFQQLTATARELGATTNWSASEAASGMKYLAMAGFKTGEIVSAMPGMLSLASAGAIDLGRGADISSNILTGFGMRAEETGRLGDVLVNTFTTSNTSLSMLGETMKYVAPVASGLGVSLEETAAMTAKLGDAGIQGSMAGTTLRAVMSRLAGPPKKAAKALEHLGVKTKDAAGNLRQMPDILKDVHDAIKAKNLGTAEASRLMKDIAGAEAFSGFKVLTDQAGSGELQRYADSLKKTGTAANVAEKQNQTFLGRVRQLKSGCEGLAITIGNALTPAIGFVSGVMTRAASSLNSFSSEHPVLTKMLVVGAAGITAFTGGLMTLGFVMTFVRGGILNTKLAVDSLRGGLTLLNASKAAPGLSSMLPGAGKISSLTSAFTGLGGALPAVIGGIKAVGLALVANPIGIVVGLLVGGALLVWKYWGPVKSFFQGLWSGITAGLAPVMATLQPVFSQIGSWLAPLGALLDPLWQKIQTVGAAIRNFFGSLFTQDTGASAGAQDMGQQIGSALVNGLKFAFMNFTPVGWIMQAWTPVTSYLSSIDLSASGRAIIETLKTGIISAAQSVYGAVKDVFDKVRKLMPFSDAKEGPFSALTASGRAIMTTMGQGLTKAGAAPLTQPLGSAFAQAQKLAGTPLTAAFSMDTANPAGTIRAGLNLPSLQSVLPDFSRPGQSGQPMPAAFAQFAGTSAPGSMSGSASGSAGAGGINITFSPQITVNASGNSQPEQVAQAVQNGLQNELSSLQSQLERLLHEHRRTSFE